MKLTAIKYTLELRHQFSISYSSRKSTPIVLLKLEDHGFIGFGEASLPPYVKENQESVTEFLSKIELKNINSISELELFMEELNDKYPYNFSAKAALNIALNDLIGKKLGKPCFTLYGIKKPADNLFTSFTIGIDSNEKIKQKIVEADKYKILKIKLGTDKDKKIIEVIRQATDKPLYADANQAWTDKYFAAEMIDWLHEKNVLLIEQPMPVNLIDETAWLKEKSPLPIIADEAVQNFEDIDKIKHAFHGINIKLMKCGGINEALRMIKYSKECGIKIMLGCMTETSCAISAAAQLSPLTDYLDLDGNLLISNDPFEMTENYDGKIILTKSEGLGIILKQNLF